jgi:CxxC motif-containing protein (DUF1111 family)
MDRNGSAGRRPAAGTVGHAAVRRRRVPPRTRYTLLPAGLAVLLAAACSMLPQPPSGPLAKDPGPRGGAPAAGEPLAGLTAPELEVFKVGRADFSESEGAADGLGPRMNLDGCGGCHLHPGVGGSSPPVNPQIALATAMGATNTIPPFISAAGPVREVRFVRNADGTPDGGVQSLFTIAGRSDAPGCKLKQPDFAGQLARGNIIFRIPTPLFGAGLIEQIPDSVIWNNWVSGEYDSMKKEYGVKGRPNITLASRTQSGQPNLNGNDGTIARFGWKAQNKSLLVFSGEAYNVEMGITNDLFQTERDETPECQFATTPNDVTPLEAKSHIEGLSAIEKFSFFMRFLAPPVPSKDMPGGADSIGRGAKGFNDAGCMLCHTPALRTGNATVEALRNKPVNLYSDLLLHDMGTGLADGILQGQAGPREFRTAPLWGLGQRLFFLHDGRTADLREAIDAHQSWGSEANAVIANYRRMAEPAKQDLLNFLRSL